MIRAVAIALTVALLGESSASAEDARVKEPVKTQSPPARAEKVSSGFARWMVTERALTAKPASQPRFSGEVGVRVLVIRR